MPSYTWTSTDVYPQLDDERFQERLAVKYANFHDWNHVINQLINMAGEQSHVNELDNVFSEKYSDLNPKILSAIQRIVRYTGSRTEAANSRYLHNKFTFKPVSMTTGEDGLRISFPDIITGAFSRPMVDIFNPNQSASTVKDIENAINKFFPNWDWNKQIATALTKATPIRFGQGEANLVGIRYYFQGNKSSISTQVLASSSFMVELTRITFVPIINGYEAPKFNSSLYSPIDYGVVVDFTIFANVDLPLEYLLWQCSANKTSGFNPIQFHKWLADTIKAGNGAKGRGEMSPANKTWNINQYNDFYANYWKSKGYRAKKLINEDGFTLTQVGKPLWIPQEVLSESCLKNYANDCETLWDKLKGEIKERVLNDKGESTLPEIKNRALALDFHVGSFYFINAAGTINSYDLSGARPLLKEAIGNIWNRAVKPYDLQNLCYIVDIFASQRIFDYIKGYYETPGKITWQDLINGQFIDIKGNIVTALEDDITRIKDACKNYVSNNLQNSSTRTLSSVVDMFFYVWSIAQPVSVVRDINVASNNLKLKLEAKEDDNTKIPHVTAMPGLEGLLPHQVGLCNKLNRNPDNVLIGSQPGSGKCQIGTTYIPTSDGLIRLKDLYSSGIETSDPNVRSVDVKVLAKEGITNCTGVYHNKGKTYQAKFNNGYILEGLAEHPLWAWTGKKFEYTRLDQIKGYYVPRYTANLFPKTNVKLNTNFPRTSINNFNCPVKMTPELAEFLGHLTAEGTISEKFNTVVFTSFIKETLLRFAHLTTKLFSVKYNIGKQNVSISNLNLHKFLEFNDFNIGRSNVRNVPAPILQSTKECQVAFLRALFDGNGTIYWSQKNKKGYSTLSLEYDTCSPELAHTVCAMLDNIGIEAKLNMKKSGGKIVKRPNIWGDVNSYGRIIIDRKSYVDFQKHIGFGLQSKIDLLKEAIENINYIKFQNTNDDNQGLTNFLPGKDWFKLALNRIQAVIDSKIVSVPSGAYGWLSLSKDSGVSIGKLVELKNGERTIQHVTRYQVMQILTLLKYANPTFKSLCNADKLLQKSLNVLQEFMKTKWRYVSSVIPTNKIKDVYDLIVPNYHNYTVCGINSHNTIILIADIADKLAKNLIHKPLVSMPKNLLAQWINEVSNFSQGKLRCFPITLEVIKEWERLGLSDKMIRNIIKTQPKNTIFFNNFDLFAYSKAQCGMGSETYTYYETAMWFRSLTDWDYIACDESSDIKNLFSNRTVATMAVGSEIKYHRSSSGTLIHNNVSDMIGQTALHDPSSLGTDLGGAIKKNGDIDYIAAAKAISDISKSVLVLNSSRREWAFALPPDIRKDYLVEMTPNQQHFYDENLKRVLDEIMKDKKLVAMLKKQTGSDEAANAKLEAALSRYLAKFEIFVKAPDSEYNEKQFGNAFSKLSTTTAEDLISPAISKVNELLADHFSKLSKDDYDGNKVIIFAFNKAVVDHFARHLSCPVPYVVFNAGDRTALRKFKTDPNIGIMIAAEASIQRGQNLQVANRVIILQSPWIPGAVEQRLSRVLRPDMPDKYGKTKYHRDHIYLDTVIVNNSIEVAKMARLFSKMIYKAIVDEWDTPDFKTFFNENAELMINTKLLSMSLDSIHKISQIDQVEKYFRAGHMLDGWYSQQDQRKRNEVKATLEKKHGRSLSNDEIGALSQIVPINTNPSNWKHEGYVPIISETNPFEREGRSSNTAYENTTIIPQGGIVMTAYGIGRVIKYRRWGKMIEVIVPGFSKKTLALDSQTVFIPPMSEAIVFSKYLKKAPLSLLTFNQEKGSMVTVQTDVLDVIRNIPISTGTLLQPNPASMPSRSPSPAPPLNQPIITTPVAPKHMEIEREFTPGYYHNALMVFSEVGQKGDDQLKTLGWYFVGPTLSKIIKTSSAMKAIASGLEYNFNLSEDSKDQLDRAILFFKERKVLSAKPLNLSWMRALYLTTHKPPAHPNKDLQVFTMLENIDEKDNIVVYAAITGNVKAIPKLRSLIVSGTQQWTKNEPFFVKPFTGKGSLAARVEQQTGMTINNIDEFNESLKNL